MTGSPSTGESCGAETVTSPIQDGLWFLSGMEGSTAATTTRAYRISGPLDLTALGSAWRILLRRHQALRTTLPERDGVPVQRIDAEPTTGLALVDATTAPEPEQVVRDVAGTVPGLAQGPLAHLTAVRVEPAEHVLVLMLHDAIADDASASILVAELSACYSALAAGERPTLWAVPPTQYAEFARDQRSRAGSARFRRDLDWWTTALTPPPPPLDLPTDRPRPTLPSARGASVRFEWTDLTSSLVACAESAGTDPEVVLLAAFQVLLHRLSGTDAVAVGMPVDLRREPDAGLVGPFANLVPMRADLTDAPSFAEHLRRVVRTRREALARADIPFDRVVRALDVERDPRRMPLLDAVFVRADNPVPRIPGAEVRTVPVDKTAVRADLTLSVHPVGDGGLAGSLAYRASLFDPSSARRLLAHLRKLLATALARPDLPVGELTLEYPALMRSATRAADRTHQAGTDRRTVTERIRSVAEQRPDAPAIAWGGTTVSYGELVRQASTISWALRQDGVTGGADAAVAVRLPPGPLRIAALLGVLDTGAHLVCLDTGDTGERGRAVLADLRPGRLLVHGQGEDDELALWFRDHLGGRLLDAAEAVTATGRTRPAPGRPDEWAYVAYTSGSTGRPKGIPTTHAGLAQFVGWFSAEFRIGPGSRVAQWAASGYDASLIEIFAALTSGATLCPVPDRVRAYPERLATWLATERVTVFQTVPSFAREVLRAAVAGNAADMPNALDHLLLAGEPLPGELADALRTAMPSVRLINLYGPTETILATWYEVGAETAGTVPIGGPIPGRQVLVLDEHDRPCPTGVTGHLVVLSPHVTAGYVGAAAGERSAFERPRVSAAHGLALARCYRTGDLGRLRWDGSLEFRGRRDLQVKLHGTRIELTDVEAALAGHESVAECAVTAVTNPEGLVTRLVAHVVPARDRHGQPVGSTADWRATLRARFGRSKLPVVFRTLADLPRNAGGKVDRRRLPGSAPTAAAADMSGVDRELAGVWSEVLGTEPAGADETFFAAGGHSLLVPVLLTRVRERVGIDLSLREFLLDPTLAGLSARTDSPHTRQAAP